MRCAVWSIARAGAAGGLAILVAGCVTPVAAQRPEPPILCERGYSNFAWGGVVAFTGIAADGQVLAFDSRSAEGPQGFALLELALPDRPRAADLLHRYVLSAPTGTVVPRDALARIAELAADARDGEIVREPRGADMGAATFECYVPLAEGIRFQRVTVAGDGDWRLRNTDPAATELVDLLTVFLGPIGVAP